MNYENLEQAYIIEGTEDGDRFKKLVHVTADDGSSQSEFVAFKKGTVREETKAGGSESVLIDSVEDSVSIGPARDIEKTSDSFEEAFSELASKMEDSS